MGWTLAPIASGLAANLGHWRAAPPWERQLPTNNTNGPRGFADCRASRMPRFIQLLCTGTIVPETAQRDARSTFAFKTHAAAAKRHHTPPFRGRAELLDATEATGAHFWWSQKPCELPVVTPNMPRTEVYLNMGDKSQTI